MTTKTYTLILSLLVSSAVMAQQPSHYGSRKQMMREIQRLTAVNDSLARSNTSLASEKDSLTKVNEFLISENEENEKVIAGLKLVEKVNDEALSELIERDDFDIDLYDEDSLEIRYFTSGVPDSVLIRRLEALNSTIDIPFNSRVRSYMVMYSERNVQQMKRLLGEAEFFFPIFEKALTEYDIPTEIKYLSIIESALKQRATSRVGAKGLWQFMPKTGRFYGLEVDGMVDERMDIYKASDAAARYLRDAYNAFGDWSLAISSYNCGSANVVKAMRRAGKSDFWSIYPYLPRETRGYLPAMVGAMYAMEYSKEYHIDPSEPVITEPVYDIDINNKIHFRQISEKVGVPMSVIDYLNPQYVRQIIPADSTKSYVLRLPRTWALEFEKADIDSIAAYKADEMFRSKVMVGSDDAAYESRSTRSSSGYYTVRRGDTLGSIAKRYGTSVAALKKANNLSSSTIYAGRKLRIPGR